MSTMTTPEPDVTPIQWTSGLWKSCLPGDITQAQLGQFYNLILSHPNYRLLINQIISMHLPTQVSQVSSTQLNSSNLPTVNPIVSEVLTKGLGIMLLPIIMILAINISKSIDSAKPLFQIISEFMDDRPTIIRLADAIGTIPSSSNCSDSLNVDSVDSDSGNSTSCSWSNP